MNANPLAVLADKGFVSFVAICWSHLREALYKRTLNARHNVTVHPTAEVDPETKFDANGDIAIGRDCRIRKYAVLSPSGGRIDIGSNSLVNVSGVLLGHGSIDIGADVLIGPQTTIVAANHTFDDTDTPVVHQPIRGEGIEIRDDVWIGANCTILDGVTLGEGCVVAAGSVVTESVPEYTVVGGTPAERIRDRGKDSTP